MRRRFALACLLLPALAACGERPAIPHAKPLGPELYVIAPDDVPASGAFVRYAPPGPRGGGLDVAVTDYERPGAPPVRLVGVVHVADAPYYEAVQRTLDDCAVVLYEAVKPADVDVAVWIRGQERERSDLAGFQHEIAGWLGFRWQLDAIDYASPRFVHADMTLEAFLEAGGRDLLPDLPLPQDGPEDGRPFRDGSGGDGSGGGGSGGPRRLPAELRGVLAQLRDFGRTFMAEDNPLRSFARKAFAEALGGQDLERALEMFPTLSDLILVQRNAVALETLEETLPTAEGTVAVFYGAAHMPGLERHLTGELGYRRVRGRWLRAWALRPPLR